MALDLIRRWCHPLEGAMEVEDGGVELTLGLSVGGSSRKVTTDAAPPKRVAETKSREVELEIGVPISPPPPSHRQPPPFLHFDKEVVSTLDQARRRDIHAFRRREARRKRNKRKHQQQKRRGICHSRSDAASAGTAARFFSASLETPCSPDDRLVMEAREQNLKAKDREAQVETLGLFHNRKLSANRSPIPNTDADSHTILNPNPVPFSEQSFSMLAMPNSFPHLPYFSNTEDLGMPCLLPCRAATMAPAAERQRSDGNIFHPVACRVFQSCLPPLVEASNRGSPPSSNAVESNSGKDAVERTTSWTASQGSSGYPAASAHYTASPTGIRNDVGSGGTSDGSSHPCPSSAKRHLHPETPILHRADCLPRGLSENCSSSCPFDPDLPSGLASQSPPRAEILPPNKRIVQAAYNSCSPPRQMDPLSSLPRMPCVSTTGNGPNGKTITGVLYRYTKAEVSIVCACHGNFFSPAEFVQHAGGTDVIHPLRQITVVSY